MLYEYEKFLQEIDKILLEYFKFQSKNIECCENCSYCCEHGDYPFSRLELEYAMRGYQELSVQNQKIVAENFSKITDKKDYVCPFLIDKKCSIYKHRSLTCRVHGLAYLRSDNTVRLPECANIGKNFSKCYDKNTKILSCDVIMENLDLPVIISSDLAKKYNIEFGELRSLVDWNKK